MRKLFPEVMNQEEPLNMNCIVLFCFRVCVYKSGISLQTQPSTNYILKPSVTLDLAGEELQAV